MGLQSRHSQQLEDMRHRFDDVSAQLADARAETLAKQDEVAMVKETFDEMKAQFERAEARVRERDERIGELETETSMYQEQILKAYQRIKADEESSSQVKRALAIALGVLDGVKAVDQLQEKPKAS